MVECIKFLPVELSALPLLHLVARRARIKRSFTLNSLIFSCAGLQSLIGIKHQSENKASRRESVGHSGLYSVLPSVSCFLDSATTGQ